MRNLLHILMVASENDGLQAPEGLTAKVGGIGDVMREVPPALATLAEPDCRITTVIPSYGVLQSIPGAKRSASYDFPFAGSRELIELYELPGKEWPQKIRHFVLHSPRFASSGSASQRLQIYNSDPPDRPFSTDATKFACFCSAVADGIERGIFNSSEWGPVNRIHLHDWHTAFLLILRTFDPKLQELRRLRTVFTIHNLSYQGIRPFSPGSSSLAAWYPHLQLERHQLRLLADPDFTDCVNPMAVGIRLANAVHVVSPSYRSEVLRPSLPSRGHSNAFRFGGEGLEVDLLQAAAQDRLYGILNGCSYGEGAMPPRDLPSYQNLLRTSIHAVETWIRSSTGSEAFIHHHTLKRLHQLRQTASRPKHLLTSVTRVSLQKLGLMLMPAGKSSLEKILQGLPADSLYVLLGNGDTVLETFLQNLSSRFENFLFLNGYDDATAAALYQNGDLFLMPSSFEPCGIAQMLAMRDGQPCVVHQVGGLKDTVQDGVTGFTFGGETPTARSERFVQTVFRAMALRTNSRTAYDTICEAAFRQRFRWHDTVLKYVECLYH